MKLYYLIGVGLLCLPSLLCAQYERVYSPERYQTAKSIAQGGSFTVNCTASDAIEISKQYFRAFKTKRLDKTTIAVMGMGGTVTIVFTESEKFTTVDIEVQDAAFSDLTIKLRNYMNVEILRGVFRHQKNTLDGMIDRHARTEGEKVWLLRKIEKLKSEIANCETRIQSDDAALQKYETMIADQKGYLAQIQKQIDDLLLDKRP